MSDGFFQPQNLPEALGFTPIACVPDDEIWTRLVTPMVRSLLGEILSGTVAVKETTAGKFAGDEVSNLNRHRLYGREGFTRMPYIEAVYRTTNGAFVVRRDAFKFKAYGWFGDYDAGKVELIFKASLRDRRFDGTKRANDTSLLDFEFDDPRYNRPLSRNWIVLNAPAVELSIYGFNPGSRIVDMSGDEEFDQFVAQPFMFLDRPELFLKLFKRAWKSNRAPGQNASPIPDVGKHVMAPFEAIARERGYDFLQMAPSHYHVASWALANGFLFSKKRQGIAYRSLRMAISRVKRSGVQLTRPQESWICVLQSLRPDLIPAELNLGGKTWMQDNISQVNLWMHKPLNGRAAGLQPNTLKTVRSHSSQQKGGPIHGSGQPSHPTSGAANRRAGQAGIPRG